jgi:hypothetical protein
MNGGNEDFFALESLIQACNPTNNGGVLKLSLKKKKKKKKKRTH